MCNLHSITTDQAAIIALSRIMDRYVGNLALMTGVLPDYSAPGPSATPTVEERTDDQLDVVSGEISIPYQQVKFEYKEQKAD